MEPIRIIIVEDEENFRMSLRSVLQQSGGFSVHEAGSGEEALALAGRIRPHIALIDLMLPGMDGTRVCEVMRAEYSRMGIIVITALEGMGVKLKCLDIGADDYLAKPFLFPELLAWVKAVLRRIPDETDGDVIYLPGLEIAPRARRVLKHGKEVHLTKREFDLLLFLARNPNEAFSRDQIVNEVWGSKFIGEDKGVDVYINRLRNKLEAEPSIPRIIKTIPRFGYRVDTD